MTNERIEERLEYMITGLKRGNHKYPIMVEKVSTGKSYKSSVASIISALGRMV